ncbi:MAG: hypothetical protein HUU20_01440 [Pirellulales bacterium]|nr:hypothetical protein [Pirellulales bacterium]
MFTSDDIQARLQRRPFVPVRVVTSSGQMFDIFHPDLVMIGRRDITIGMASVENPRQYERQTHVAIMHVTALEDLPAPTPPRGNGEQES